jgi:hypothetical protein
MGEAGGEGMGNLPAKILHGGAGETSPPAFAASCLRRMSRSLFVFCFERDPMASAKNTQFQKAKVLRKTEYWSTDKQTSFLLSAQGAESKN